MPSHSFAPQAAHLFTDLNEACEFAISQMQSGHMVHLVKHPEHDMTASNVTVTVWTYTNTAESVNAYETGAD